MFSAISAIFQQCNDGNHYEKVINYEILKFDWRLLRAHFSSKSKKCHLRTKGCIHIGGKSFKKHLFDSYIRFLNNIFEEDGTFFLVANPIKITQLVQPIVNSMKCNLFGKYRY